MEEYYRKRAPDYERFYYECEPVLKEGNQKTADLMQDHLKNRSILEIACGTGYWTRILSLKAKEIIATDILPEVLHLAQEKEYDCPVQFLIADAYDLPKFKKSFNGGLANFWFSHVPKEKIDAFLESFHQALEPNSHIFLSDNNPQFLPDGKLITFPNDPNTYRFRTTQDGSEHYVLKNYYSISDLVTIFSKHAPDFDESNVYYDQYFWRVVYKI